MSGQDPRDSTRCERLSLAELSDYVAGELNDAEAADLEEHVFSCAACAAKADELEALVRGVRVAVTSGEMAGFVTDEVLNRLARDGVRVRTFALTPGTVIPCAVWEGDEMMALRLRGDFGDATEVTVSKRVAGIEVDRVTGPVAVRARGEIIVVDPAARIRELPEGEVQIFVTAHDGDGERVVATYMLLHGGVLPGL